MVRIFALGWFLWSTVGFIILSGWAAYHAFTVRQDRWMFAIVPTYWLLSWSFFKAFQVMLRKSKPISN
jgi:hypothetical protein